MFDFLHKTPVVSQTSFSRFIREASSGEKKRVYTEVMRNAINRQIRVIEQSGEKCKDSNCA